MHEKTLAIVLGCIIAEQAQIKNIGRAREKFEWREIAFVQRTGVRPNPADAALLEQSDDLRPVPAGMAKLDREPKTFRKLHQKFSQRLPPIFRRERWRQLNENDLKLRFERFDRAQKRIQFIRAIAQFADMRDLARQFAAETKRAGCLFNPTPDRVLGGHGVKCGIDFDRGKIARVEFQPFGFRQIGGIKASSPVRKTPGAGADADFLLVGKVQTGGKSKLNLRAREDACRAVAPSEGGSIFLYQALAHFEPDLGVA